MTAAGFEPKCAFCTRSDQRPGVSPMRYLPLSSVVTRRVTPKREKTSVEWP